MEKAKKTKISLIYNSNPKAVEDLRDLRKYIEDFFLFLPLPVCSVNPFGMVIDANRIFYNITGYKKNEGINGETILRINNIFQDQMLWKRIEKKILRKEFVKNQEMVMISRDGIKIPISLSASWREDENNDLIGYFLAFFDITEIKSFQNELERKVEERTEELQRRIKELEKFHKLVVGRELKMIELKKEIKKIKEESSA
jgi:PAS domain S-box-containing protein